MCSCSGSCLHVFVRVCACLRKRCVRVSLRIIDLYNFVVFSTTTSKNTSSTINAHEFVRDL